MNALLFDADDWRETYAAYVKEFKDGTRGDGDQLYLKIRLKRLGFIGTRLNDELRYIKAS